MYKPFANAKILLVWINGKPSGRIQYTWKNARTNAEKFKSDIFATNQIEILDLETGEIIMVQRGVKHKSDTVNSGTEIKRYARIHY